MGTGVAGALVEPHTCDEAARVRAELGAHFDGRGVGLGRVAGGAVAAQIEHGQGGAAWPVRRRAIGTSIEMSSAMQSVTGATDVQRASGRCRVPCVSISGLLMAPR